MSSDPSVASPHPSSRLCGRIVSQLSVFTVKESLSILLCFFVSVSLVNSVKLLMKTLEFPFPLFISACHMAFSWCACYMYILLFEPNFQYASAPRTAAAPEAQPSPDPVTCSSSSEWAPSKLEEGAEEMNLIREPLGKRGQPETLEETRPSSFEPESNESDGIVAEISEVQSEVKGPHWGKIFIISLSSSLSIASANLALKYIYPSFHEVLQQLTPAGQVFLGLSFGRLERLSKWSVLSLVPICGGAILCAYGEVNFHFLGTVFSVGAVVFRCLKSFFQEKELTVCNPPILLLYLAPINMGLFTLWFLCVEGVEPLGHLVESASIVFALLGSCLLACSFQLVSFYLMKNLSAIGLSIIHNAKIPAICMISYILFSNPVTDQQVIGFFVVSFGVWAYRRSILA